MYGGLERKVKRHGKNSDFIPLKSTNLIKSPGISAGAFDFVNYQLILTKYLWQK